MQLFCNRRVRYKPAIQSSSRAKDEKCYYRCYDPIYTLHTIHISSVNENDENLSIALHLNLSQAMDNFNGREIKFWSCKINAVMHVYARVCVCVREWFFVINSARWFLADTRAPIFLSLQVIAHREMRLSCYQTKSFTSHLPWRGHNESIKNVVPYTEREGGERQKKGEALEEVL